MAQIKKQIEVTGKCIYCKDPIYDFQGKVHEGCAQLYDCEVCPEKISSDEAVFVDGHFICRTHIDPEILKKLET